MGNLIKSFGYTLATLYVILSGYTLGFVSDNGEGRGGVEKRWRGDRDDRRDREGVGLMGRDREGVGMMERDREGVEMMGRGGEWVEMVMVRMETEEKWG